MATRPAEFYAERARAARRRTKPIRGLTVEGLKRVGAYEPHDEDYERPSYEPPVTKDVIRANRMRRRIAREVRIPRA